MTSLLPSTLTSFGHAGALPRRAVPGGQWAPQRNPTEEEQGERKCGWMEVRVSRCVGGGGLCGVQHVLVYLAFLPPSGHDRAGLRHRRLRPLHAHLHRAQVTCRQIYRAGSGSAAGWIRIYWMDDCSRDRPVVLCGHMPCIHTIYSLHLLCQIAPC